MNKAEADKIKVTEDTIVANVTHAEDLQKWAYRRLVSWPELLAACEEMVAFEDQEGSIGCRGIILNMEAAIAAAKGTK